MIYCSYSCGHGYPRCASPHSATNYILFFTCSSVVLIKVFPILVFTSFVSLPYNCLPIRLFISYRVSIPLPHLVLGAWFFPSVYSPAFSTIKTWSNSGFVDYQLSITGILFNLWLLLNSYIPQLSMFIWFLTLISNHFASWLLFQSIC